MKNIDKITNIIELSKNIDINSEYLIHILFDTWEDDIKEKRKKRIEKLNKINEA